MSIWGSTTTTAAWRRYVIQALTAQSKGVTILDPVGGDSISIWVPKNAVTITGVSAHRQDGTSFAFNIKHGSNPGSPATALWDSNETVTATTSIDQTFADFDNADVTADHIVKLEITAVTGSVSELHVTIEFEET